MKQQYRYILATVVAVLTLASCGKEDIVPDEGADCPTFSALIGGGHTRATDDYWERDDKIGISVSNAINICHVTEVGDGNFTVKNENERIYFSAPGEHTFIAYYPWHDFTGDKIQVDISDQSMQKSFDFLWASAKGSKNSPVVEFNFTHKMSKVTFVFKNGENMDVSSIYKVRLNGSVVEGTFDLTTGICVVNEETRAGSTTLPLTHVKEETPVTPLFLFPQRVEEPLKLEIYAGDNQYFVCTLAIPDNELEAATDYNYTITVNKTGLKVSSCTISDWIEKEDKSDATSADE